MPIYEDITVVPRGTGTYTNVEKPTASYTNVEKPTASYTNVEKPYIESLAILMENGIKITCENSVVMEVQGAF